MNASENLVSRGGVNTSISLLDLHPRGRVLVVDDEPASARLMERYLSTAGFVVEVARNGTEAIIMISGRRFDVVVSDLVMPRMSGIEFMRVAERMHSGMTFVLVTAQPSLETVEAAADDVVRYVCKPIERDEFRRIVRQAVAISRSRARDELGDETEEGEDRLQRELNRGCGNLRTAYQPVVRLTDGKIAGHRALVRDPRPGLSDSEALSGAARQLGEFAEIGRTVRRLVAGALQFNVVNTAWVEVDGETLADPDLGSDGEPLTKLASRVVLELTDLSNSPSSSIDVLRARGYQIAISDPSPAYLGMAASLIEPDAVKLQPELIRRLAAGGEKATLVKELVESCRRSGATVVAEGVESPEDLEIVRQAGIETGHGGQLGAPRFIPGF